MADIRDTIARMEPRIRQAFLEALEDVRSSAQLSVIVRALEQGRIDDALRAVNLQAEFFAPLDDALRAAYLAGGRDALIGLSALVDPFPGCASSPASTGATPGPRLGSPGIRRR